MLDMDTSYTRSTDVWNVDMYYVLEFQLLQI